MGFFKGFSKGFEGGGLLGGIAGGTGLHKLGQGLSLLGGGMDQGDEDPMNMLIRQMAARRQQQQSSLPQQHDWSMRQQPMPYLNNPYRQRWS